MLSNATMLPINAILYETILILFKTLNNLNI